MGGAAPLAQMLGPDEDMAKPVGEDHRVLVCQGCALEKPLFHLWERCCAPGPGGGEAA